VILLAGLAVGVFVYFLVGFATGYAPDIRVRRLRPRTQISTRQLWLNQAGVAVTPRQFVAGSVAVGALAFLAIAAVTGAPLVAVVPAAGVSALPRAYFARRRAAHVRRVQAAWPDGLRDVIASIGAGRSLQQALNTLAASGLAPLHEAFARFPMLSRMLGTVPALEVIKEELADPSKPSSNTHRRTCYALGRWNVSSRSARVGS
jgi:Flp pilus assembly protein TadB